MTRKFRPEKRRRIDRPLYRDREEVPVLEFKYEDHDGRWYGSGWVIFDSLSMPLTIRFRWRPAGGQWEWRASLPGLRSAGMALRKISTDFDAAVARGATVPETATWPQLLEHLVLSKYPDGAPRQTSSLVVLCDGQAWRVCLSDRDNARVMWKTGNTLLEALDSVELALLDDDPSHWRRSAEASGKRRK